MTRPPPLPWLAPGDRFPDPNLAWGPDSPAPGLLASGGRLDVDTLRDAYRQGIFPWYSEGQPILWWSPDPRMVLPVDGFRLHRSMRKTLQRFAADARCEVRFDHAFGRVIRACAGAPREGQGGTWIGPDMITAYERLHRAGLAHSVETWVDGHLVAGLYGVSLGRMVFGESMFTLVTDGSKIALAALVAFCRAHDIAWIDCQQNTRHLTSLGAREMPRAQFRDGIERASARAAPPWRFLPIYWNHLLTSRPAEP